MCGFIAKLVEHRTDITEVTGSNPVEALIFFQASSFQLLKLNCDDHSSLSVQCTCMLYASLSTFLCCLTVAGERDIVLEVSEHIKPEVKADLLEWVCT